jgi:uncharacterized protein YbjT (DUF2867 family)
MKTAIVIGATGLVGRQLVELLLKDSRFAIVKVLARRSLDFNNQKLEEHIIDFDEHDSWKKLVTGDVLYSAMGTTLGQAGSKDAQYKIDFTYQYRVAKIAAANDVKEFVLISAAGASPESKIFYSRMKGELEREVQKLPFETIHILRPGMLSGERAKVRTGEKIGIGILNVLSAIPGLRKLKPVGGDEVARAMINATFRHVVGIHIYTMGEVLKLATRNQLATISVPQMLF